jgi:hypothetical protein
MNHAVPRFWRLILALTSVAVWLLISAPAHAKRAVDHPADDSAEKAKAEAPADPEKAEKAEKEKAPGPPVVAKIGIILSSITKFELGPGTYQAEFGVTVICPEDHPCKPELEAENGKLSTKELVIDTPTMQVYRMRGEFAGNVDLSEFPFDKHELGLVLYDKTFRHVLVQDMTPEITKIDSDVRIPGWGLRGWEWTGEKTDLVPNELLLSTAGVKIQIERPRLASFFKSLVPLCFMVLVAGFTLLLKPKSAAGRLTTATGALMTLVMFHISSTSQLPALGYMTRLDKFMVATYFVYLVNIAFAIAIVRFDEAKNEKFSLRAYHVAQGTIPGLAIALITLVFGRLV